jgi:hypothetical protein
VQPNRPCPKPVNARFFTLTYELRCWSRFSWLCLKTGLILAICWPLGFALFPLLFWALFLDFPLMIASHIQEGWPESKARSLLALDPQRRMFSKLSLSEQRKWRAYEKAKKGLPLTTDDIGSRWTDQLYEAIVKLDLDGAKTALINGASPTAPLDGGNCTPLWLVVLIAQRKGNETRMEQAKSLIAALLETGADLSVQELSSILVESAKTSNALFFLFLDQPGGSEAASLGASLPILRAAAEGLRPAIWLRLLKDTPSLANVAVTAKDYSVFSFGQHRFGDDVSREGVEGNRALHFLAMASERHFDDMARRQGHSWSGQEDKTGDQALAAIRRAAADCVSILLAHGADIEARGFGGRTPLLQAIWHGSLHVATLLLDAGAKAGARDTEGRTSLDMLTHIVAAAPRGWWARDPQATQVLSKRLALAIDREAIEEAATEAIPAGDRREPPDGAGPRRL